MITLYTKPNCQPCIAVKRYLTQSGVEYEERPAEDHPDYLSGIGARSAPVVVSGDTVICGFNPNQLKALCDGS